MPNYVRNQQAGATYFFTINLLDRQKSTLIDYICELRQSYSKVQQRYPFKVDAMVILPDHIHALWSLPQNDLDYSKRIRLFKTHFTKQLPSSLKLTGNQSRQDKQESGVWQRRFWEHTIRSAKDFDRHMDYIHYNPVKHGYVDCPADWTYSTFLREVNAGRYDLNWAGNDLTANFRQ